MEWNSEYQKWLQHPDLDKKIQQQLLAIEGDREQLEDCFYTQVTFGTGGMRGKIGPGTNRINIYTIRKAAVGLARFIEANGTIAKRRGVVIAYDSRHQSAVFAMEAAKTLGYQGIQTFVFESLRTTPELSFAVRYLHAFSGIVITASHNPSEYNGFKVYGEDGAQYASEEADVIADYVKKSENELEILVGEEVQLKREGLLKIIGKEIDDTYLQKLQTITIDREMLQQEAKDLRIVYTPLHGTGNLPVRRGLAALGFNHVHVVKEQELPDADFSTVESPNPEESSAFTLAMEEGATYDADLLLATDPDADRVGVAIKADTGYQLLTGNQVGAILLHYMITQKQRLHQLPDHAVVLKTIVTSELGKDIAKAHGIDTIDVLTGFKYISEKIKEFEKTDERTFLFGYEESYGYLIGDFVRDKDAVQACLLIAEAAAYYKSMKRSLHNVLQALFEVYGYYKEEQVSLTLEGKRGMEQIETILQDFRKQAPTEIATKQVLITEDYLERVRIHSATGKTEKITLPTSNVLKYKLTGGAWFCIRPSGTEPKIKFYFAVKEKSHEGSVKALRALKDAVMQKVNANIASSFHR